MKSPNKQTNDAITSLTTPSTAASLSPFKRNNDAPESDHSRLLIALCNDAPSPKKHNFIDHASATCIQAHVRTYLTRKRFQTFVKAVIVLQQCWIRRHADGETMQLQGRNLHEGIAYTHVQAATKLQAFVRSVLQRKGPKQGSILQNPTCQRSQVESTEIPPLNEIVEDIMTATISSPILSGSANPIDDLETTDTRIQHELSDAQHATKLPVILAFKEDPSVDPSDEQNPFADSQIASDGVDSSLPERRDTPLVLAASFGSPPVQHSKPFNSCETQICGNDAMEDRYQEPYQGEPVGAPEEGLDLLNVACLEGGPLRYHLNAVESTAQAITLSDFDAGSDLENVTSNPSQKEETMPCVGSPITSQATALTMGFFKQDEELDSPSCEPNSAANSIDNGSVDAHLLLENSSARKGGETCDTPTAVSIRAEDAPTDTQTRTIHEHDSADTDDTSALSLPIAHPCLHHEEKSGNHDGCIPESNDVECLDDNSNIENFEGTTEISSAQVMLDDDNQKKTEQESSAKTDSIIESIDTNASDVLSSPSKSGGSIGEVKVMLLPTLKKEGPENVQVVDCDIASCLSTPDDVVTKYKPAVVTVADQDEDLDSPREIELNTGLLETSGIAPDDSVRSLDESYVVAEVYDDSKLVYVERQEPDRVPGDGHDAVDKCERKPSDEAMCTPSTDTCTEDDSVVSPQGPSDAKERENHAESAMAVTHIDEKRTESEEIQGEVSVTTKTAFSVSVIETPLTNKDTLMASEGSKPVHRSVQFSPGTPGITKPLNSSILSGRKSPKSPIQSLISRFDAGGSAFKTKLIYPPNAPTLSKEMPKSESDALYHEGDDSGKHAAEKLQLERKIEELQKVVTEQQQRERRQKLEMKKLEKKNQELEDEVAKLKVVLETREGELSASTSVAMESEGTISAVLDESQDTSLKVVVPKTPSVRTKEKTARPRGGSDAQSSQLSRAATPEQQQTLMEESGKMLEFLRREVVRLRQENSALKNDLDSVSENTQRLIEANSIAQESFSSLNETAKEERLQAQASLAGYKQQIHDLKHTQEEMNDLIKMKQAAYISEVRSKKLVEAGMSRIVDLIQAKCRDSRLVEAVLHISDEVEEQQHMDPEEALDAPLSEPILNETRQNDSMVGRITSFFSSS